MRNSMLNNSRSMNPDNQKYKNIVRRYLKQIEELKEENLNLKSQGKKEENSDIEIMRKRMKELMRENERV